LKVAIRLFWKTTWGGLRVGSGIAAACLGLPEDREGVARVGEVRLYVLRLPWLRALEDGREEVRGPHLVAGLHERSHRRPANLAPRPRHEYQHTVLLLVANRH
jgi:hypothetical protein